MKLNKEKLLIFGDKYDKTGRGIGEDKIWGAMKYGIIKNSHWQLVEIR